MRFIIRFLLPLIMVSSVSCYGTYNNSPITQPTPPVIAETNKKVELTVEKKQNNATNPSLEHLREWIGKYPTNPNQKKYRSFFAEPEVKTLVTEIVGQKGFQNLLRHFYESFGDDLIYERKEFLVLQGISKRKPTQFLDYGLVAINLRSRETHIFLVDDQKLTSFTNTEGDGILPIEIKEQILAYTDTSQSLIIGAIKQIPEGFGCYALLNDDKKQQIFIVTDEGQGLMNIEGQDVLLKYVDSVEHKSENGKKRYEWIYGNKNIKATFKLSVTKTENEGKHLFYDGKVTVSTSAKIQTVQVKATCYD